MRPQDRPRPVPTRPVSATSWPAARRGRVTGTDLPTRKARQAALDRYGLSRFLRDWDVLLGDAATNR